VGPKEATGCIPSWGEGGVDTCGGWWDNPTLIVSLDAKRRLTDLRSVFPKSRVSEILRGKRSISKKQALQLADIFRVPVELFL